MSAINDLFQAKDARIAELERDLERWKEAFNSECDQKAHKEKRIAELEAQVQKLLSEIQKGTP